MADEFKAGEVVKLKSGGPKMTVSHIGNEYDPRAVYCVWFEGNKKKTEQFPPDALEHT
jgi:uncharacterized protein YodC (DUF2158 family)